MITKRFRFPLVLVLAIGLFSALDLRAQQLGNITFPTSGAPAAQASFIEGVKELHSFQFEEAAIAFQRAEKIDPNFAMAYWGEAMSHNHPLWAEVDVDAAKKALEKLAPTLDGRAAKAATPKEKAYLDAVNQLFYTPGDKLARDNAYSKAMASMYERWSNDDEVSILYALSLLGTVRPGDIGFRRQALAASIALRIFQENPQHPGAAHFIIHAFDDPDHAILALPAAREYAKIAPAAAHALHMPSHIFVQLGMWSDVVASNTVAYKASEDVIARLHTPEGREDFHTLSWLEYAHLMMGNFDEAQKNIALAKQAAERNPGNGAIQQSYLGMRARYILESGKWEKISLPAATPAGTPGVAAGAPSGANTASTAGMAGMPGGEPQTMRLDTTIMESGCLSPDTVPPNLATLRQPIRLPRNCTLWPSAPQPATAMRRNHLPSWKRKSVRLHNSRADKRTRPRAWRRKRPTLKQPCPRRPVLLSLSSPPWSCMVKCCWKQATPPRRPPHSRNHCSARLTAPRR